MKKKFLVLNQAFQPQSPVAFGWDKAAKKLAARTTAVTYTPDDNLMEEADARAFAEHLAGTAFGQTFTLVEVHAQVKAKPPVVWEPVLIPLPPEPVQKNE